MLSWVGFTVPCEMVAAAPFVVGVLEQAALKAVLNSEAISGVLNFRLKDSFCGCPSEKSVATHVNAEIPPIIHYIITLYATHRSYIK